MISVKNSKFVIIILVSIIYMIFLNNLYGGIMLNVTWSAKESSDHYRIRVEKSNSANETVSSDPFFVYSKENHCKLELDEGFIYSFQVQSVNEYGACSEFTEKVAFTTINLDYTSTEEIRNISGFRLNQNQPNPFNPSTTISYSLPNSSYVQLVVYNIQGQKIAELQNGFMDAGEHSIVWNAAGMPSGTYVYTLKTKDFLKTDKMLLLK